MIPGWRQRTIRAGVVTERAAGRADAHVSGSDRHRRPTAVRSLFTL
jgi:hypothetical protein